MSFLTPLPEVQCIIFFKVFWILWEKKWKEVVSDLKQGIKIGAQITGFFLANFKLLAGFFWYWFYYSHRSRDFLSPLCRTLLYILFVFSVPSRNKTVSVPQKLKTSRIFTRLDRDCKRRNPIFPCLLYKNPCYWSIQYLWVTFLSATCIDGWKQLNLFNLNRPDHYTLFLNITFMDY